MDVRVERVEGRLLLLQTGMIGANIGLTLIVLGKVLTL